MHIHKRIANAHIQTYRPANTQTQTNSQKHKHTHTRTHTGHLQFDLESIKKRQGVCRAASEATHDPVCSVQNYATDPGTSTHTHTHTHIYTHIHTYTHTYIHKLTRLDV
jgi:hypothetical protein